MESTNQNQPNVIRNIKSIINKFSKITMSKHKRAIEIRTAYKLIYNNIDEIHMKFGEVLFTKFMKSIQTNALLILEDLKENSKLYKVCGKHVTRLYNCVTEYIVLREKATIAAKRKLTNILCSDLSEHIISFV
jgi:iron-sulfur cluster repair protein YtfE (RIC family)